METATQLLANIDGHFQNGVETDGFASSTAAVNNASRVVIATFNIRYAVGSFLITGSLLRRAGLARPHRRSALVERHISKAASFFVNGACMPSADIIALQEADRETARAGGHHVAGELARALGMNYAHAAMGVPHGETPQPKQWYLNFEEPIAVNDRGDTGIAILSRLPLLDAARVELPCFECAWRPRLALTVKIPLGRNYLRLFNSHIDPHASIKEQLAQHEAILASASKGKSDEPVVVLGDFNTLTKASQVQMRRLLESHGYMTPMPTGVGTWRAGLVRLHTDWIFVRGVRIARWGVARPLSVSDHWPLWAEIELDR